MMLFVSNDLDRLNSWNKINKLYFNLSKYHVVHSAAVRTFFLSIIYWIMLFLQLLMRSAIWALRFVMIFFLIKHTVDASVLKW